eukprot:gene4258-6582_t
MTPNGMGTLLFWFYSKLPFICLNPPSSADLTALRRAFKRQVTERKFMLEGDTVIDAITTPVCVAVSIIDINSKYIKHLNQEKFDTTLAETSPTFS